MCPQSLGRREGSMRSAEGRGCDKEGRVSVKGKARTVQGSRLRRPCLPAGLMYKLCGLACGSVTLP